MFAIKVSATAANTIIFISSASLNITTYKKTLSSGATEILTFTLDSNTQNYSCDEINAIETITANGAVQYAVNSNKSLQSAAINGDSVKLVRPQTFAGNAALNGGINQVNVSATDGSTITSQDQYQQRNGNITPRSLIFDSNGNMTSDGTNTFEWDADDRLIKINYPGTGQTSTLSYDASGRNVKIVEAGGTSSTKQFVWSNDDRRSEIRDGSNMVISQVFSRGETINGDSYLYTKDHLGSVREMSSIAASIILQQSFDPCGLQITNESAMAADIGYAGYYLQTRSGLNLTLTRAYSPIMGRFINRDVIGENGGVNLYQYVGNDPINLTDRLGTQGQTCHPWDNFERPPCQDGTKCIPIYWRSMGVAHNACVCKEDPLVNRGPEGSKLPKEFDGPAYTVYETKVKEHAAASPQAQNDNLKKLIDLFKAIKDFKLF